MKKSLRKFKFRFLIFALSLHSLLFAPLIKGQELTITDNGSGSTSEVSSQLQTDTSATQNNTATIDNSVITSSTTGSNTASENTNGDTTIQTGDATSQTSVENQVNSSTLLTGCCDNQTGSNVISGNGDGSTNTVNSSQTGSTEVTVVSTAKITNNISGYVNTGNNLASGNSGGDVTIKTGDINVLTNVTNGPVNTASAQVTSGNVFTSSLVTKNGASSTNTVQAVTETERKVNIINLSDIRNLILWDLSTGGNEASGNSRGNVKIETGSIDLNVFIKNFANIGGVALSCCQLPKAPESGDGEQQPAAGKNPGISNSVSGGFSGSSIPAGAEAGAGGPGILGLSDTSSGGFQSTVFFIGLLMFTLGLKLVTQTLVTTNLAKRATLI